MPAPAPAKPAPALLGRLRRVYASSRERDGHRGRELAGVRHRELDRRGPHLLRPRGGTAAQVHARLRPPAHLDLLPREVDARPERLADRLLRGESTGVVLGRVRLRVAVCALHLGEAALFERVAVTLERQADPLDLDQVYSNLHSTFSSHSGSCAIDEMMPSGCTCERSTSSGRNFPVRTSTVCMPCLCAPTQSPSTSSPTIHVSPGSASSAPSAAAKYSGDGFPSTVASVPDAYSSPATNAPASRRGPSVVCHQRFLCRQYRSAPASSSWKARFRFR